MLIYHEASEPSSTSEVVDLTKLDYPVLILNKRGTDVVYVHDMYVPEYLDYIAHPKYYAAWLEEPVRIDSAEEIERKKERKK